jgi:hypothetical protein
MSEAGSHARDGARISLERCPAGSASVNPRNQLFDEDKLRRGVGIRSGTYQYREYCISEGWVRVQAGKSLDAETRPLTIKLTGAVEAGTRIWAIRRLRRLD